MTSIARRTNLVIVSISSIIMVLSTIVAIAGNNSPRSQLVSTTNTSSPSTTSTTTTEPPVETEGSDESDVMNPYDDEFKILEPDVVITKDKQVSGDTSYWLDESVPTRQAATLSHNFNYSTATKRDGGGTTEEGNSQRDFAITPSGPVTCPKSSHFIKNPEKDSNWIHFEACSVMSSDAGQFIVIMRSASLNNWDKRNMDALKVEIFVPRAFPDGTRRAVYVLGQYFSQSLCDGRQYISVAKARVGHNDVLLVKHSYGFDYSITQTTVVAMNSSGMPVVVASYEIDTNDDEWAVVTDRSLVLVTSRVGNPFDEGYDEYTLTELVPGKSLWLERIHINRSETDSLFPKILNAPRPFIFAEYTSRTYDDDRSNEWCSLQN